MSRTTAGGAMGLALASSLAWLCCLPIATGTLGVALAAVAPVLGPWWPLLGGASLALLGVTVAQTFRGNARADRCEIHSRGRWLVVGAVAVSTIALLTLPWWSAEIVYRLIR